MSGKIQFVDAFICSVGSEVTFSTPSGVYRYQVYRELAEYIKKKGRYQPGKMLNLAKKCAYTTKKLSIEGEPR